VTSLHDSSLNACEYLFFPMVNAPSPDYCIRLVAASTIRGEGQADRRNLSSFSHSSFEFDSSFWFRHSDFLSRCPFFDSPDILIRHDRRDSSA
jgi:hypothetical protein